MNVVAPNGFISQKNYASVSIEDFTKDPNDPNATYAVWDGSGDTEVLVEFPDPVTPPSGPQSFSVRIRKAGGPGGRLQDWQLELWQGGAGLRVLAYQRDVDLPEDGVVVTGSWEPSWLVDPSGHAVQLKMRQTGDGAYGPPQDRRAIEAGGMIWTQS